MVQPPEPQRRLGGPGPARPRPAPERGAGLQAASNEKSVIGIDAQAMAEIERLPQVDGRQPNRNAFVSFNGCSRLWQGDAPTFEHGGESVTPLNRKRGREKEP